MRFSTLIAVLVLLTAGLFAYQNQTLLYQEQAVLVPGGTMSVPLVGILLLAGVGATILLWLADMVATSAAAAGRRRLENRLAQRERELAELNSGTHVAPATSAPPREPVGR
ncbi:MAG TPA: hypothetical protein VGK88_02305 [bacterium]